MYKFDTSGEKLEQAGNTDNSILLQNKYQHVQRKENQSKGKNEHEEKTTFQTLYDARKDKLDEDNKEDQLFGVDVAQIYKEIPRRQRVLENVRGARGGRTRTGFT